ncbi:MAG: hypothetical protein Q9163_005086 [Psora crenata]
MASVDFGRYKRIVQGFFDTEPENDDVSGAAIWCLGREYTTRSLSDRINIRNPPQDSPPPKEVQNQEDRLGEEFIDNTQGTLLDATAKDELGGRAESKRDDKGWPTQFLDDCESRIWLTYRSNFPPIRKYADASLTISVRLRSLADQEGFTSDTGWGCMIRSGQCLLANALAAVRLGRGWRRGVQQEEEKRLLSLFADDPNAPFSIHKFVEHGAVACDKYPGEWFGPSATARCIQALSHGYDKAGLNVYVNADGADVYEDRFSKLAKSSKGAFTPTVILLGTRLGIDRVTSAYWEALKASLELPQSLGIAGGRPSSSHYFFAHQGDHFFYLDPHFTRHALPLYSNPADYTAEQVQSCHTRKLRRLALKDMDPSMLLAFLIIDEADWRRWREAIKAIPGKAIVQVSEAEPSLYGHGTERQSAVDEVETFDDEAGDDEGSGQRQMECLLN